MLKCPRCKTNMMKPEVVTDLRLRRVMVMQGVCEPCAVEQMEDAELADTSWKDIEEAMDEQKQREIEEK